MQYPTVFPALVYDDPSAAIDFLTTAFGAEQHAVYGEDGAVRHAELSLGNGLVMFSAARPDTQPAGGAAVYVAISDPDARCARAREAERRSSASRTTRTMDRATSARRTPRATSGTSARTSRSKRTAHQPLPRSRLRKRKSPLSRDFPMERAGIEPATSGLQSRRSPS